MSFIKRVPVLLAMLIGLAAPLVAIDSAEAAGTPGCVTRAEWSRVHKGQTSTEVTRILGASGRKDWFGSSTYNAIYRSCTRPSLSFVGITFSRSVFGTGPFRVQFKAASFG